MKHKTVIFSKETLKFLIKCHIYESSAPNNVAGLWVPKAVTEWLYVFLAMCNRRKKISAVHFASFNNAVDFCSSFSWIMEVLYRNWWNGYAAKQSIKMTYCNTRGKCKLFKKLALLWDWKRTMNNEKMRIWREMTDAYLKVLSVWSAWRVPRKFIQDSR
jgi:hypothetical protein